MSDKPPTPTSELPADIIETVDECSPERLRHIARYAEDLAAYRERKARLAEDGAEDGVDDAGDQEAADLPDGVPSKATITVKEINDNRYYYWQWRDGDQIRSQYKGPVNADESQ